MCVFRTRVRTVYGILEYTGTGILEYTGTGIASLRASCSLLQYPGTENTGMAHHFLPGPARVPGYTV